EDQVRAMVRRGLPAARAREGAPRHPARPVRPGARAPGRARADRRVSGTRGEGARRPRPGDLGARGQAGRAAGPDPRLRGGQAPKREALPRRGAGARLLVLGGRGPPALGLGPPLLLADPALSDRRGGAGRTAGRRLCERRPDDRADLFPSVVVVLPRVAALLARDE